MKAQELRIGNYVYSGVSSNSVIEVYPMFIHQFNKIEDTAHNIKPIPLTEEWLVSIEKCIKIDKHHFIINVNRFGKIHIYLNENNEIGVELGQKSGYTLGFIPNFKYLHQLQNLYFALTNEELTLKK